MYFIRYILNILYRVAYRSEGLKRLYRITKGIDNPQSKVTKYLTLPLKLTYRLLSNVPPVNRFFGYVKAHNIEEPKSLSREEKVFFRIEKTAPGLEIGPSHQPFASKRAGFNVHVLDHLSAAELREKYKKKQVDTSQIEDVDFVWNGEPYSELIGKSDCYSWIIASHVIEHTPDLLGFLRECESLLSPDGVLSLVIPDRRYCFDHFVPETTTGAVLDAFFEKKKKRTPGQVFDHLAHASRNKGQVGWTVLDGPPDALAFEFSEVQKEVERCINSDEYIDGHTWRFTPKSFSNILFNLQGLSLISLTEDVSFPTVGCEFYVTLRKSNTNSSPRLMSQSERLKRLFSVVSERT
jgi:SAM-dependent methyltransferase